MASMERDSRGGRARYTIDELGALAAAALAEGYEPPENGQVSAVPARRSIRYYTTLGLLDRPAEMRGRQALYAPRHLRQLVAIKRLQAQGLSLAAIQARLSGLPDAELEAIARLSPERHEPPGAGEAGRRGGAAPRREAAFWRQVPAAPARASEPARGKDTRGVLVGVAVEPGIWIQFEPARALERGDAEALRRAAQPMADALRARGLVTAPAAATEKETR